jgi:hypothetical protein
MIATFTMSFLTIYKDPRDRAWRRSQEVEKKTASSVVITSAS